MHVHTNQRTHFESQFFVDLLRLWLIHKKRTTAYHLQGKGACERANSSVLSNLKRLLKDDQSKDWELYLPQAAYAYNTSVHSAPGHTRHFLTDLQDPRTSSEISCGPASRPPAGGPEALAYQHFSEQARCFAQVLNSLRLPQHRSKAQHDKAPLSAFCPPANELPSDSPAWITNPVPSYAGSGHVPKKSSRSEAPSANKGPRPLLYPMGPCRPPL